MEETKQSAQIFSRIGLFALLWSVLLVPVFYLPVTQFPFSFNQQNLAFLAVLVGLFCLLVLSLTQGKIQFPKGLFTDTFLRIPLWFLAVVFLVALFSSVLLSSSRGFSFWGVDGAEADSGIALLLSLFVFLLSVSFISHASDGRKFLKFLTISSALALVIFLINNSLITILKKPGAAFSALADFNTVGTIGAFAGFLGVGFLVTLMAFIFNIFRDKKTKTFGRVLLVLHFLILVAIAHRPVLISIIVSLIIFLVLYLHQQKHIHLAKFNVLVFFISVFIILNFISLPLGTFFQFSPEVSLSQGSSLSVARQSLTESVKNFLFGSGLNTYAYQYAKYKPQAINGSIFWNVDFRSGASWWLTLVVSLGLLGTLALLLFFISLFVQGGLMVLKKGEGEDVVDVSDDPSSRHKIISMLMIVFFYMLVLSVLYAFNFIFVFLLFTVAGALAGMIATVSHKRKIIHFMEFSSKNLVISLSLIVLVIVSLVFAMLGVKRYTAYAVFDSGIKAFNKNQKIDQAIAATSKAFQLHPNFSFSNALSVLWFQKFQEIAGSATAATVDQAKAAMQGAFDNSVAASQVAINLNPQNYFLWASLGNMYEQVLTVTQGADKLALQAYTQAKDLNPKNPLYPLNLARIEIIRADNNLSNKTQSLTSAEKYINQAIALKGDSLDAYLLLAQVYQRQGRLPAAVSQVEKALRSSPQNIGLLFQLGFLKYQLGDISGARGAFANLLSINPNYSNAKYYLGLIYDRDGNKQAAIKEFEEILQLNPGNADVKRILDNLKSGKAAL